MMREVLDIKQSIELRIRPWENIALLCVLKTFSEGALTLDMRKTGKCLGSRVAQLGNRKDFVYMGLVFSYALRTLYFPGIRATGEIDYDHPAWDADAKQGAQAIAIFLTSGDPRWDSVMRRRS